MRLPVCNMRAIETDFGLQYKRTLVAFLSKYICDLGKYFGLLSVVKSKPWNAVFVKNCFWAVEVIDFATKDKGHKRSIKNNCRITVHSSLFLLLIRKLF